LEQRKLQIIYLLTTRGVWGGNAWKRRSHIFFTFCFKRS